MAASCPGGSRPAHRKKHRLLAFWNQHEIKTNHGIFFKTAIALTQVIKRWQTAGRGFDFQDWTNTKGLKCLRKTEEGKENVTVPFYEGEVRYCLQLVCMRNRKPLTSWARVFCGFAAHWVVLPTKLPCYAGYMRTKSSPSEMGDSLSLVIFLAGPMFLNTLIWLAQPGQPSQGDTISACVSVVGSGQLFTR